MKFIPALLNSTIDEFSSQLHALQPYFNEFSIDIQDGSYVPSVTISTKDVLTFVKSNRISKKDIFDFDLMTYDFKNSLQDIESMTKYITVRNVFIHFELLETTPLPVSENFSIGLALEPQDTIENLSYYINLNKIPCLQIMSIHSGKQGQSFMPEQLKKIEVLKSHGYRNSIYIDGSVNEETIPYILNEKYKPDYACVGSFLSKADENLKKNIDYLLSHEN